MVTAIRSILAVALLCATAGTGRAEQIGARQTLECRGAYCVPVYIEGAGPVRICARRAR